MADMKIAIYQINMGRDHNRVAFQSICNLMERFQDTLNIDSEIYDRVFCGSVDCNDLEDVYRMFNVDHPAGYMGRSLSVSDIVETIDENGSTFHFCDSIGFKTVNFDPSKTVTLKENKIRVVMCAPGETAKVEEITNTLEGLQAVVGGYIEAVYPFEEQVCIVCNEESKFNGMEPNRGLYDLEGNGHLMDFIFGPFFICDCSGENFGSLSDEQAERYTKLFRNPEMLANINGELVAIPYCEED